MLIHAPTRIPWIQLQREPRPVVPHMFVTCSFAPQRRLGNAMFTFASLIGIARQNNMTPIIDRSSPRVSIFQIVDETSDNLENTLSASSVVDYSERKGLACTYDAATRYLLRAVNRTELAPTNVRLCCYFQSWRYFDQFADRVRQNFWFREPVAAEADAFLSSVPKRQNATRVGVHVRRGDMVGAYLSGYTVAPPDYFRSAMRYFTERYRNVQFIVCSDYIAWCRKNLPALVDSAADVEMEFSEGRFGHVDLAILARCDHIVMSVGTFGWWAAWLANGTTVYYADWPRPATMLSEHCNKSDYFPPHWIGMR